MDASNASHGDMGQINSNDVVILISLSGSSNELRNIIQFAQETEVLNWLELHQIKNQYYTKIQMLKFLFQMLRKQDLGILFQLRVQQINLHSVMQ